MEYNTCDRCKTKEPSKDLIWLTSEGFRPKKGEIVPKYAYEVFDALCEKCYLSIITIKEIDKCPFYSNKCPECNSALHQVHYADGGDAENIWWCTNCDVAIDSSGGYTK